ncbi:MAG: hypothetical protein EPN79_15770 [Burkholderiaceae bacterium]|nr:MAG: hypothetical protein EPN79_15770 [Burkholderiaceae bacterium]
MPRRNSASNLTKAIVLAAAAVAIALLLAGMLLWDRRADGAVPVSQEESRAIEEMARATESDAVWSVYLQESKHGLTKRGASRVIEAAKAAPPPFGLISPDRS